MAGACRRFRDITEVFQAIHSTKTKCCKATMKAFKDHVPASAQKPEEMLLVTEYSLSTPAIQGKYADILRKHFDILAQKFMPDEPSGGHNQNNTDKSGQELTTACYDIMGMLNKAYTKLTHALPASDGRDATIRISPEGKLVTKVTDNIVTCQHSDNFAIYGPREQVEIWTKVLKECEYFEGSHRLTNNPGVQFGSAKNRLYVTLYDNGTVHAQGIMGLWFGIHRLGIQLEQVIKETPSTTQLGTSTKVKHYLKMFEGSRPTDVSHRITTKEQNLTNLGSESWESEDDSGQDNGQEVWAELRATRLELTEAREKIALLESKITLMEKDNLVTQSTFGPKLADVMLRLAAIEEQRPKLAVEDQDRPSYSGAVKAKDGMRSADQTMELTNRVSQTRDLAVRARPKANKLVFDVQKNVVIHSIHNIAEIKGDDQVRKEIGKICSSAIVDTISRSHPTNPKIFVQLRTEESVDMVLSHWDSQTFGGSCVRKPQRKPRLCTGVAKGVPLDISDDELQAAVGEVCVGATTTRLTTRRNGERAPLHAVKVVFASPDQLQKAIAQGLLLRCAQSGYNISVGVEEERFTLSVTQCYQCYKFGHIAQYCVNDKVCRQCGSAEHDGVGQCPSGFSKCINCKGDHAANNRNKCPVYQRAQARLDQRSHTHSHNA